MCTQVYLAVDYEAQVIKLAEVKQNAVTPYPVHFQSSKAGCSGSKLAGASIAAIVLGVVIGLALIICAGYCIRRQRGKQGDHVEKAMQHNTPPIEQLAIATNLGLADGTPLSQEISGERRTFELWSPNGGHPDASPRAPHKTPQVTPPAETTALRESVLSTARPPTHAAKPWLQ